MLKSKEANALNSIIPGRNLLKSVFSGSWNVDYTRKNESNIKSLASAFAGRVWGFIADITDMEPILDDETSYVFSCYHEEFFNIGCRAYAFITNNEISIKAQPGNGVDISKTKELYIGHFNSYEDAYTWLESLGF